MAVFQSDSFQGDALGGDAATAAAFGLCDTLGGLNFGSMILWVAGLGVYTSLWNDSRANISYEITTDAGIAIVTDRGDDIIGG